MTKADAFSNLKPLSIYICHLLIHGNIYFENKNVYKIIYFVDKRIVLIIEFVSYISLIILFSNVFLLKATLTSGWSEIALIAAVSPL